MINKNTYWIDFWNEHSNYTSKMDEQSQVLRTINKKPINKYLWEFTLNTFDRAIETNHKDDLLELCCGNGLISKYFSNKVNSIVSVDSSKELIKKIDIKKFNNISVMNADIRDLSYKKNSFNKIIIYAGIQYLSYSETIEIFEKIFSWLKKDGILFLGDIPNSQKLWKFYNTPERQATYFNNLKKDIDVVGTWFNSEFFYKLSNYIGFSKSTLVNQNSKLIYSNFRYDFKFIK